MFAISFTLPKWGSNFIITRKYVANMREETTIKIIFPSGPAFEWRPLIFSIFRIANNKNNIAMNMYPKMKSVRKSSRILSLPLLLLNSAPSINPSINNMPMKVINILSFTGDTSFVFQTII
ncbi:120aa long hypothetical protein [Pyrococcus horikoshii OT3]|uniref:Uncharacterized protein n=1 Tax=Pyrococcus horikoshii (strain ATCC 700860 / DSM 12428 / JCM 9974 / NBRC 100139 / OT-3) TaxID=70601 RepID=O58480_PYRHO|nr:120aa long hypothetical protein [Pyrococcus horikoshii OT3]